MHEHGVEPVAAVGLLRAAGPLGADVAEDDPLGPVDLDRVAPGVLHGEVLEGDVLLAGDEQPLAAGPLPLVLEAEDRLVRPLAADRHAADVERERRAEVEPARAELDDIARLGVDHGRLGPLGGIRAGLDPGHFRLDLHRVFDHLPGRLRATCDAQHAGHQDRRYSREAHSQPPGLLLRCLF